MTCKPDLLRSVPLFSLLDDDETSVLAGQVDVRNFATRERIYKIGEPSDHAYVVISGKILVSTVDEDQQEVLIDHGRLVAIYPEGATRAEAHVQRIKTGAARIAQCHTGWS